MNAAAGAVTVLLAAFAATADAQTTLPFVKGHSWGWTGVRGTYAAPAAADSMRLLAETGADTVCICFAAELPAYDDPRFSWGDSNPSMVSDDEVRRAVDLARARGLRVILKPVVNCADGTWRAWIRFYRDSSPEERAAGHAGVEDPWGDQPAYLTGKAIDEQRWAEFWERYRAFVVHYAAIARETRAEAFCVGCEMNSTESDEARWRETLRAVRAEYDGPLIYNVNHGREAQVPFWDAIDVMGVSAYFATPPREGQSEEQAVAATTPPDEVREALLEAREELRRAHRAHGKPILFIEVGVTNVRGCARYPWTHPDAKLASPLDEAEQAGFYRAMFETFWDEPWFAGYAWWDWPAELYPRDRASEHRGFCVFGKRAEGEVRAWYAKPAPEHSPLRLR